MNLSTDPRLPQGDDVRALKTRLAYVLRENAQLTNQLAEGRIAGVTNAAPSVPTTGTYAPGDEVRNSAPVELGTAGSKYIVRAWLCVGSPLSFVQQRIPTGN